MLGIFASNAAGTALGTKLADATSAGGNVTITPTGNYLFFVADNTTTSGADVLLHTLTVTPDAVPEPASLALLCTALLGKAYSAIISQRHYKRLADLVDDAGAKGARIIEIGERAGAQRVRTMPPTMIVGATSEPGRPEPIKRRPRHHRAPLESRPGKSAKLLNPAEASPMFRAIDHGTGCPGRPSLRSKRAAQRVGFHWATRNS